MKKKLIYIIALSVVALLAIFFLIKYYVNKNPLDVDVSDIKLEVKVERFDLELQQVLEGNSYDKLDKLEKKYGGFFTVYNKQIISIGGIENESYLQYLSTFLSDYAVVEGSKQVEKSFPDFNKINEELTIGFKHLLYYYPEVKVPRIVSFVAGFNQSVVSTDGFIGIGIDKYLGADCQLYDMLEIPDFAKFEMCPNQIPIDVMTAYVTSEFPFVTENETLLNRMVYNGMVLYFLDAMYPEIDEARKCKYTQEQLDFCVKFERDMWTNLIENKLLFITEFLTVKKFVESAPNTYQFGPTSPPRTANWIGLQIVRSYMKNNSGVSLQDLMLEKDYQKILNLSQYDPKY
jgi:hypothetical protein